MQTDTSFCTYYTAVRLRTATGPDVHCTGVVPDIPMDRKSSCKIWKTVLTISSDMYRCDSTLIKTHESQKRLTVSAQY